MPQKLNNAVLLGLFDGVHRGHLKTVTALKSTDADEKIVYSFSFDSITTKGKRVPLVSDAKKCRLLVDAGADRVVLEDFSRVKDLEPEQFVDEVLINRLAAKIVICGENFRFGRGAKAGIKELRDICSQRGVSVRAVSLESDSEGVISTTRIRRLLEEGSVDMANMLLGRCYSIEGSVIHGTSLGTKMGVKTINLAYDGCLKNGVYATNCIIDGKKYKSVTNIGFKPSVSDGGLRGAETHILDFDMDVYGRDAEIEFLQFYREEKEFSSKEELIKTITNDIVKRKESVL